VLYAAIDLETAFVESILRDKAHLLPAGEHLFIDYETLASRYIATLSPSSCNRLLARPTGCVPQANAIPLRKAEDLPRSAGVGSYPR
jgi:hypothetical protein